MAKAKHSNGRLFRIPTGFPNSINKVIFSWFASCDRPGNPCRRGNPHADGHSKKAAATLYRAAAAVFPQQKTTGSVLADPSVFPHLSSSSDLRILSSTQPSQVSPMTDFRQVWCLHAYSGGTVRDSHPVFYSLVVLLPHPQALKRNIYLHGQYTRLGFKCQSQKEKTLIYDTNRNINR